MASSFLIKQVGHVHLSLFAAAPHRLDVVVVLVDWLLESDDVTPGFGVMQLTQAVLLFSFLIKHVEQVHLSLELLAHKLPSELSDEGWLLVIVMLDVGLA